MAESWLQSDPDLSGVWQSWFNYRERVLDRNFGSDCYAKRCAYGS
jgi:hypothetical protein